MADPVDKDFKVIRPIDIGSFYEDGKIQPSRPRVSHRFEGSFPCGREKGIESRIIRFSGYNSCDHCVIEWIWNTPGGKIRECADVMVAAGEGNFSNLFKVATLIIFYQRCEMPRNVPKWWNLL
mgnify:CR=1 FL=1